MTDLQNAEVRAAYLAAAIFHQQANARYACAPAKDRAAIAEAHARASVAVEQRIVEAEAAIARRECDD